MRTSQVLYEKTFTYFTSSNEIFHPIAVNVKKKDRLLSYFITSLFLSTDFTPSPVVEEVLIYFQSKTKYKVKMLHSE